jgi:hypothetical protein
MKRISRASTHNPICVENGGAENTIVLLFTKYSLTVTVSSNEWCPPVHFCCSNNGGNFLGYKAQARMDGVFFCCNWCNTLASHIFS